TYHQLDYLFSYTAGPLGLSDTGQMQQYLFLPYWFWGLLMAIASLMILIQSLRVVHTQKSAK
ncbi:MAG: M50 family metallopeptidase, partial [Dolichospermum sp.]